MQYIAPTLGAIVSVPLSIEELEALRDAPALKKVIQTRVRPAILAFLMKNPSECVVCHKHTAIGMVSKYKLLS